MWPQNADNREVKKADMSTSNEEIDNRLVKWEWPAVQVVCQNKGNRDHLRCTAQVGPRSWDNKRFGVISRGQELSIRYPITNGTYFDMG